MYRPYQLDEIGDAIDTEDVALAILPDYHQSLTCTPQSVRDTPGAICCRGVWDAVERTASALGYPDPDPDDKRLRIMVLELAAEVAGWADIDAFTFEPDATLPSPPAVDWKREGF